MLECLTVDLGSVLPSSRWCVGRHQGMLVYETCNDWQPVATFSSKNDAVLHDL